MQKLKAVLIGYGNMGKSWATVISNKSSVDIVGVVDISETNLKAAQNDLSLHESQVGSDLAGIINDLSPDFILDCSIPASHYKNSILALEKGCHVLGEKPIALDIPSAQKVVELATKKNKIYMVNQNYRWRPMFSSLKKYIDSGALGKILTINVIYAQNFVFKDTFRYQIDHPLILDMSVHHFDLVRSLASENFKDVYCVESRRAPFKGGSSVSAIFTMQSGTIFTYQGSWSDIGSDTSFIGNWRISFENGTITWDGSGDADVEQIVDGKKKSLVISLPGNAPIIDDMFLYELNQSLDKFLVSIDGDVVAETWCGDNIHTLDMVLSSIYSSESKKLARTRL